MIKSVDRQRYNIYIILLIVCILLPIVLSESFHVSSNRLTRHDIATNNNNNNLLDDDYSLSMDDSADLYEDGDIKQLEADTLEDLNEQDSALSDFADLSLHANNKNWDRISPEDANPPIQITGDLIRFEAADPSKTQQTTTTNTQQQTTTPTRPKPTTTSTTTQKPTSTTTPTGATAPKASTSTSNSTVINNNNTINTNQQPKYDVSPFPHTYDEAMHPDETSVELHYCIPQGAHYDNWPNPKPPMCDDNQQPCVPKGYKVKNIVLPKCPETKLPTQQKEESTSGSHLNNLASSNTSTSSNNASNKKDDDVYVPLKPKNEKDIKMPKVNNVTIDKTNEKHDKKTDDHSNGNITPIESPPSPAPKVIDLSGYLRLDRLMQRFEHAIRLGRRAAKFDDENDLEICTRRINSLNNSVNHLTKMIQEAQVNLTNAIKSKEDNVNKIAELQTLIEPKAKAIAEIDDEIAKLKAKKKVQLKVYENRLKDTDVVYEAVNSIFSRLSMSNSTNAMRFRQEIFQAAAVVHDASVHSLLENALGAVSGSDKIDITQLRQLFALLLQDLQTYVNIVKKTKLNDDKMWDVTQKQMNAQKLLLEKATNKWLASIDNSKKHINRMNEKANQMQKILNETPNILELKKEELKVWNTSCEADAQESEQERISASVQLSTIVSMRKTLGNNRYYSVGRVLADVVDGIKLPHLMITKSGKRCCIVCKRGQACGDGCIHAKSKCNITQTAGCACNYDDMSTSNEIMTNHQVDVQNKIEGTRINFHPKSVSTPPSTATKATQTTVTNSKTTTTTTNNRQAPRFRELPQIITLNDQLPKSTVFVGGETISPSFSF